MDFGRGSGSVFTIDEIKVQHEGNADWALIDFFDGQLSQADRENHASELATLWTSLIGT